MERLHQFPQSGICAQSNPHNIWTAQMRKRSHPVEIDQEWLPSGRRLVEDVCEGGNQLLLGVAQKFKRHVPILWRDRADGSSQFTQIGVHALQFRIGSDSECKKCPQQSYTTCSVLTCRSAVDDVYCSGTSLMTL
ncbi:hypothetical protein CA54_34750 [Symmachiella macrocystis]|uniref:Uncharacterized protein n=1 Tax=Symmachiella macrocystis TaxID=2527985 RepID=A0A5C6BTV1_9PLAN|nr:hypothetical protein CA54_34750 [Symmachiella macrocystis]